MFRSSLLYTKGNTREIRQTTKELKSSSIIYFVRHFHHMQHRDVESLNQLVADACMPLHPGMCPLRLYQQDRPHPAGLLEEVEELRFGRRICRPERRRVVHLTILLPGPCLPLALCAVVLGLGKGHGDAHPCIAEVCAEASLPPTAGTACAAACFVVCSHHHRKPPAGATNTRPLSLK